MDRGDQSANGIGIGVGLTRLMLHLKVVFEEFHIPSHQSGSGSSLDGVFHRVEPS